MKDLIRVSKQHPCHICGETDWCSYNARIALCMRRESAYPTKNGGWTHILGPDIRVVYEPPVKTNQPIAPVHVRDRVYRAFLHQLSLNSNNYNNLINRGLSDIVIRTNGYRSLPLTGRAAITKRLLELGHDLKGIPGFYQKEGNPGYYWTFAGSPGLLIPYRQDGLIHGLQIRPDHAVEGKKYVWFSSYNRQGGAGSGSPFHIAAPVGIPAHRLNRMLYITEGALKADITAEYLVAKVYAVPGVNTWHALLDHMVLLNPRPALIAVAYDMDLYEKAEVMFHYQRLQEALLAAGLEVVKITWDPKQGKGIDDLLVTGEQPIISPLRRVI